MIRIGTRGSLLARAQTAGVVRRLREQGVDSETTIIKTIGDKDQARAFADLGTPGLFVREIERALLDGRIDLAVHSYKDLPSASPPELVVTAVPERLDPADRLIARPEAHEPRAEELPLRQGATIGTASARREALVRHLRPDLQIRLLRGNVPTRLARLKEGRFDAILLASAGLARLSDRSEDELAERADALERDDLIETRLEPERFVPAPSQGALALQARVDDRPTRRAVAPLDLPEAHRAIRAERALLRLVEGGCQLPFGAWADVGENAVLQLVAVLEWDGRMRRASERGGEPSQLAARVWDRIRPDR